MALPRARLIVVRRRVFERVERLRPRVCGRANFYERTEWRTRRERVPICGELNAQATIVQPAVAEQIRRPNNRLCKHRRSGAIHFDSGAAASLTHNTRSLGTQLALKTQLLDPKTDCFSRLAR